MRRFVCPECDAECAFPPKCDNDATAYCHCGACGCYWLDSPTGKSWFSGGYVYLHRCGTPASGAWFVCDECPDAGQIW